MTVKEVLGWTVSAAVVCGGLVYLALLNIPFVSRAADWLVASDMTLSLAVFAVCLWVMWWGGAAVQESATGTDVPQWVDRRERRLLRTAIRRVTAALGPLFFALSLFIFLGTRGDAGAWGAAAAIFLLLGLLAVVLIMAAKTVVSLSAGERKALGILALVGGVVGLLYGVLLLLP